MITFHGILNDFRSFASNYSYITLSGELSISHISYDSLISNDALLLQNIKDAAKSLSNIYPKFKVDVTQGVSEISIKVFAYKMSNVRNKFLDELQADLENLTANILSLGDIKVRLNVFGSMNSLKGKYSFRYLNNVQEVKYKITDVVINNDLLSKAYFIFRHNNSTK